MVLIRVIALAAVGLVSSVAAAQQVRFTEPEQVAIVPYKQPQGTLDEPSLEALLKPVREATARTHTMLMSLSNRAEQIRAANGNVEQGIANWDQLPRVVQLFVNTAQSHALYRARFGSALHYWVEQSIARAQPPGFASARPRPGAAPAWTVRFERTSEAEYEIERMPCQEPKRQRLRTDMEMALPDGRKVVFDWTTARCQGKIVKYFADPTTAAAIELVYPDPGAAQANGPAPSASAASVTITQNATYNGRTGVRFDIAGIHILNMTGQNAHAGFNVRHAGKWMHWIPVSHGKVAADDEPLPNLFFFYTYEELRGMGQLDQLFEGWFYIVATDTKVDLLEKGPNTFKVEDAAPAPAGPAVYQYSNPANTVSIRMTDGTADNWGTLTGHGSFTFLGARLDCQFIVERHVVYGSDPKTYDYATNVKPGPECQPPHRFVNVDGIADFQAQSFYSYPNGYGYLYLTGAVPSVMVQGVRMQAANPVDLAVAIDAVVPHMSFNLSGNDVQYGRFHFAPGGFNVWKDGIELKVDSGYASIDGQEAKNLMSIRWTRQPDGYHLQYGFGSEWTAKLPQYNVR